MNLGLAAILVATPGMISTGSISSAVHQAALLAQANSAVADSRPDGAPALPEDISKAGFPQCKNKHLEQNRIQDRLSVIDACRVDWENFREGDIEERGRRLDRYKGYLVRYDTRNRLAEQKGTITADEYNARADFINFEFEKLNEKDGEYRATYRSAVKRYKQELQYLKGEVCNTAPTRCRKKTV